MWDFPLFPESASTVAREVDAVYAALCLTSGFFIVLIGVLLLRFAFRYRRASQVSREPGKVSPAKLEMVMIGGPTVIALAIFTWAAVVFFKIQRPPADTLDIYVVGKQWMWKVQHPGGQREINTLHVPLGQPVKLIMTSQDVIHSFYVPAFRVKNDVLPGRYTTLWFNATQVGEYHLFCAEYCGADHSRMIGKVVVLDPRDYDAWLGQGGQIAPPQATHPGYATFAALGCNACHVPDSAQRAPRLEGLFGRPVTLRGGETVVADEAYLRESILQPNSKVVEGYPQPSLMPPYDGQVNEDQLSELVEYIKSLSQAEAAGPDAADAPAASHEEVNP